MADTSKTRVKRSKGGFHYWLDKQPIRAGSEKPVRIIKRRKSDKKLVHLKIAYLTERLGGVLNVADAVQADKSRVSRWVKGAEPDDRNSSAINDLEYIYQRLSSFLDDESADKWIETPNSFLNGQRPIEAIHQGRMLDVLSAANQEEAGSYT